MTTWTNENNETYTFDMDHLDEECEQIASNLGEGSFDYSLLLSTPPEHRFDDDNDWCEEYHKVCECYEIKHHDDTLPLHEQGEKIVDDRIKSWIMTMGLDPQLNLLVDLVAEEGI